MINNIISTLNNRYVFLYNLTALKGKKGLSDETLSNYAVADFETILVNGSHLPVL